MYVFIFQCIYRVFQRSVGVILRKIYYLSTLLPITCVLILIGPDVLYVIKGSTFCYKSRPQLVIMFLILETQKVIHISMCLEESEKKVLLCTKLFARLRGF